MIRLKSTIKNCTLYHVKYKKMYTINSKYSVILLKVKIASLQRKNSKILRSKNFLYLSFARYRNRCSKNQISSLAKYSMWTNKDHRCSRYCLTTKNKIFFYSQKPISTSQKNTMLNSREAGNQKKWSVWKRVWWLSVKNMIVKVVIISVWITWSIVCWKRRTRTLNKEYTLLIVRKKELFLRKDFCISSKLIVFDFYG